MTVPRLSVAHLTAIDLPPPALIHAAAEAGLDAVGLRLLRITDNSPGYPLMDDPALMAATQAALAATGLSVSDIEFVRITPETEVDALLPFLDAGARLGAGHVITAPYDPEPHRLVERLGALAEAAAARGLGTVMEFFPWTVVPDLDSCWRVVRQAGPDVGILVDSLHFNRSGSSLDSLAAVPPHRLPFAHFCDAPVQAHYTTDELLHTARAERLPPGAGGIDLVAFLRALPAGLPLGLEVPTARPLTPANAAAALRRLRAAALEVLQRR